jgi:hypothetical protein|tara:strand:+ start:224 stop:655 length:432 start_codon:yes stop_codon:yes gene_type:complete
MANTTNQGWAKPTIGGSEDTWGTTVNNAIDAIDTLVGGVTAAEVAKLDGLTATTAELNALSGMTATAVELSYSDGVTSAIQTQLNAKAPLASPTFTGSVTLGDWAISLSGSDLIFSHSGTARLKLSSAGALTAEGDVTAFGDA